MEKIKLNSGQTFILIPNGIRSSTESMTIELTTDQTITDLDLVFSTENNTRVIQMLSAEDEVLKLYKDFVICSDITLRKDAIVGYQEVQIAETEDKVWEPVYGKCVTITLRKRDLKFEVNRNRADIEYIAIMNDLTI